MCGFLCVCVASKIIIIPHACFNKRLKLFSKVVIVVHKLHLWQNGSILNSTDQVNIQNELSKQIQMYFKSLFVESTHQFIYLRFILVLLANLNLHFEKNKRQTLPTTILFPEIKTVEWKNSLRYLIENR